MSWTQSLSATQFLLVALVFAILAAVLLPVAGVLLYRLLPEPPRPTSNDPTYWCHGCELLVRQSELVSRTGYPDCCESCARETERECTCYEYHGGHMPGCPAGRWEVGS